MYTQELLRQSFVCLYCLIGAERMYAGNIRWTTGTMKINKSLSYTFHTNTRYKQHSSFLLPINP